MGFKRIVCVCFLLFLLFLLFLSIVDAGTGAVTGYFIVADGINSTQSDARLADNQSNMQHNDRGIMGMTGAVVGSDDDAGQDSGQKITKFFKDLFSMLFSWI